MNNSIPRKFKRMLWAAFGLGFGLPLLMAATPIIDLKLTGWMDGGGQAITNVVDVTAADGSSLTNAHALATSATQPADIGTAAYSNATDFATLDWTVECAGGDRNAFFFTAGEQDIFRSEAAVGSVVTNQDVSLSITTADPVYNDVYLFPDILRSRVPEAVAISVAAGDGYTFDGTNTLTHTASSNVTATAIYAADSMSVTSSVAMAYSASGITTNWYTSIAGTVREATYAAGDLLVAGKSAELFADYDWETDTAYTYNTNCWAYSLAQQLTCVSPRATGGRGTERSGTLISPIHFVNANHFWIGNGQTVYWAATDGTVVSRTVVSSMQIDGSDIRLYRLSSAVDTNVISVAKFLPSDWADYMPTDIYAMPLIGVNKKEQAFVVDGSENQGAGLTVRLPSDPRLDWHIDREDGDSGNPAFLLIGSDLVLMTTWTGTQVGPSYSYYASLIEAGMATLGGGYTTLEYVDLSSYTEY